MGETFSSVFCNARLRLKAKLVKDIIRKRSGNYSQEPNENTLNKILKSKAAS